MTRKGGSLPPCPQSPSPQVETLVVPDLTVIIIPYFNLSLKIHWSRTRHSLTIKNSSDRKV